MVEFDDDDRRVGSDTTLKADPNYPFLFSTEPLKFMRPAWEYLILDYDGAIGPTNDNQINMFNALGAEGWELVETKEIERHRFYTTYRAIFKRTKET